MSKVCIDISFHVQGELKNNLLFWQKVFLERELNKNVQRLLIMEHENHLEPLKDLFPLDDINHEASSFNGLTRK